MFQRVAGKPIPARRKDDHWVERVRPGATLHLVVLSEALWGMDAHWTGSKTIECIGEGKGCRGCVAKNPIRWKGGAHVYDLSRKESYFIELTPGAARRLMAMTSENESLRGLKIDVFRSGRAVNGRLCVELIGGRLDPKRLPAAQSPEAMLRWLWNH